jgi:fused signal recognition particle receptor
MAITMGERLRNFFGRRQAVSEELFEELADLLVEGDFAAAPAFEIVDKLRERCRKERILDPADIRLRLAVLLEELLVSGEGPELSFGEELGIILLLGVNGVGKTTTAAKLAHRYTGLFGKKVILAAADTFRAGAIEQLRIHGERLQIRVVAHQSGGDPAAVVYDALEAAHAGGGNLIIADTAGRMHTKSSLVEELKKIDRVVESRAKKARYIKWLVLDATTGQNALAQAEIFHHAVALDGIILTKFDAGARGGAAFSLSAALGLPVVYICDGEKYDDLRPFDPRSYARRFAGLE